jgi:hypothetical protein
MSRTRKAAPRSGRAVATRAVPVYTLEIILFGGRVPLAFARRNPLVARTLLIRGDQTLADLHQAILAAFGRREDRPYEFQFGKGPMDPQGKRYVPPAAARTPLDEVNPPAGLVTKTRLASLRLKVSRSFLYWFDFTNDWWHRITVAAIRDRAPRGKFPRMLSQVGDNPPQQAADDADADEAGRYQDHQEDVAADMACLVGELHLNEGRYEKAVVSFSRAIAVSPTRDAYQGRAKAYQALALEDERRAAELR